MQRRLVEGARRAGPSIPNGPLCAARFPFRLNESLGGGWMKSSRDRTLPTLAVLTCVSRPENLPTIARSIGDAVEASPSGCPVSWHLVVDARHVTEESLDHVHGGTCSFPVGVRFVTPQSTQVFAELLNYGLSWVRNSLLVTALQERRPCPWVCFLDDDTVMHPDLVREVSVAARNTPDCPMLLVDQERSDGSILTSSRVQVGFIDVGQGVLNLGEVTERFPIVSNDYDCDGSMLEMLYNKHGERCLRIEKILSFHNALRSQ